MKTLKVSSDVPQVYERLSKLCDNHNDLTDSHCVLGVCVCIKQVSSEVCASVLCGAFRVSLCLAPLLPSFKPVKHSQIRFT